MKKKEKCPECNGTGERGKLRKGDPSLRCQDCNGSGEKQHFEMIFWRYDQFPYLLASRGFMEDNGMAYCPSYQGHFRPVKVLPLEEGKELWAILEGLQRERNTLLKAIDDGFTARLNHIAPWRNRIPKH